MLRVLAPDLASAVAERLSAVVPAGYTVTAQDTEVTVMLDGERVGSTAASGFLETVDGLKNPQETLARAARVILDNVQDWIADTSGEPWPGDRNQPMPAAELIDGRLEMWFGDRDNPTLRLEPIAPD